MDNAERTGLKKRVGLIDEVRGLSIVLMVVYHTFFDLVYIFGMNIPIFNSGFLDFLQQLFAGLFILISGVACRYSKNNLKRGAICFAIGLGLTAVTLIFMPQERILFGILHFLGVSMMLFALLHKLLDKLKPWLGAVLSAVLFLLTFNVARGTLGIGKLLNLPLPAVLYKVKFLFPLGFAGEGFFSADYFPLLPWVFLFAAGVYLGVYFKQGRMPEFCYETHAAPLSFVGRHTLIIYVLHQPVVYGVLYLIFYLLHLPR